MGQRLDSKVLEVVSNLNDSVFWQEQQFLVLWLTKAKFNYNSLAMQELESKGKTLTLIMWFKQRCRKPPSQS